MKKILMILSFSLIGMLIFPINEPVKNDYSSLKEWINNFRDDDFNTKGFTLSYEKPNLKKVKTGIYFTLKKETFGLKVSMLEKAEYDYFIKLIDQTEKNNWKNEGQFWNR
jgi:hypothetical protein